MRLCFIIVCFVGVVEDLNVTTDNNTDSLQKRWSNRCNIWTGLRPRTCIQYVKTSHAIYRKCGWLFGKRCRKGTRYSTKSVPYGCPLTCTVHGNWGSWTSWKKMTDCFGCSCNGRQIFYRHRMCNHPTPKHGGRRCSGMPFQTSSRSCVPKNAIVNGQWSDWGEWKSSGPCSKKCGRGIQNGTVKRSCSNPHPRCGGKTCKGISIQQMKKPCSGKYCIKHGKWSHWTNWKPFGRCSQTCGYGVQFRFRTRTCDPPENGGKPCYGKDHQQQFIKCSVKKCPKGISRKGKTKAQ